MPLTIQEINVLKPQLKMITLHWSAGSWSQVFEAYHFGIKYDKKTDKAILTQTLSLKQKGAHTFMRNTGNIGISLSGMAGGYDIQPEQVELMAKLVAELCLLFDIDIHMVHDHAYWAKKDGYFPTRWDIGPLFATVYKKAEWYVSKLKSGEQKFEYTQSLR